MGKYIIRQKWNDMKKNNVLHSYISINMKKITIIILLKIYFIIYFIENLHLQLKI